jgi:hypothetical protein
MTLTVITEASSVSLIAAVMTGDAAAKAVLHAADRALRQIHRRPRARALTCWLCDSGTLWRDEPPAAIAVLTPYAAEPACVAIGLALCQACASDCSEREVGMAAVAKLRAGPMPDLRVFQPMAEAGHA